MAQLVVDAQIAFEDERMDEYRKDQYVTGLYLDGEIGRNELVALRAMISRGEI